MRGRETTEDKERACCPPPSTAALTDTCLVSGSVPEGPPDSGRGPGSPLPALG